MKRCLPGLMTILFLLSLMGCSDDAGTTDSNQSGADGSTLDALASLDGTQGYADGSGRGTASDGYTGSKGDGSIPEEDAGDESGDTDAPSAEDGDSGTEDGDADDAKSIEDTTLNDSTESDTESEDAEGADGSENDGELSDTDEGDAESGDTDAGEDANDGREDATDSGEEDSTEDAGDTGDAGDADVEEEDVYVPPVFSCTKDGDCVLQFPNLSACEVATCFVETGDCGVILLSDDADRKSVV